MTEGGPTVLMAPMAESGPTNNSLGIGDALLRRGFRVVFATERSWAGRFAALGFEEEPVDLHVPPGSTQDVAHFWVEFVEQRIAEYPKPTVDQIATIAHSGFELLISGAQYSHARMTEIVEKCAPDVIVQDNMVEFPALRTAGVPFVRVVSCNPLELKGPDVPPTSSGYPIDDRTGWQEFRQEYDRRMRPLWDPFSTWVVESGAPKLADLEFINPGDLNLYLYPQELDYIQSRPLGSTWHRLDSSVRETESPVHVPPEILNGDGALIYFSLGTVGSADVGLMRKLIGFLAGTRHRYIVSMGPRLGETRLPPNVWGAPSLPQTTLIPLVDLVITHGGNNTMTESMHFGKPMLVLPIFWDQYDNAQRVQEKGYGVRLAPYRTTEAEFQDAIERLLKDSELRERCARAGKRIRSCRGVHHAAELVESLVS